MQCKKQHEHLNNRHRDQSAQDRSQRWFAFGGGPLSSVGPSRIEMANGNSIARPAHGLRIISPVVACSFRGQTIVIDSCKFQQSSRPPPRFLSLSFPFPSTLAPAALYSPSLYWFRRAVYRVLHCSQRNSFLYGTSLECFPDYTCGRSANPLTSLLSQKKHRAQSRAKLESELTREKRCRRWLSGSRLFNFS